MLWRNVIRRRSRRGDAVREVVTEKMEGVRWGQLTFSREGGRSVASRVYATSPLKFMVPTKVSESALSYFLFLVYHSAFRAKLPVLVDMGSLKVPRVS